MAKQRTMSLAGSEEYGPRMPGPPLPMQMVVRFEAQSEARALIVREGTPVIGEAQSGVLGTPSSRPIT